MLTFFLVSGGSLWLFVGLLPYLTLVFNRVCPLTSGEDADTGDPEDTATA
ncbi:acyl-CoA synthetase long chain family member 6 [Homo sapiens]|uniref:Acyl-CoA synthetase long chain family member 6 n=1 Tax=Homo sapiens TaxID=9606 RepID=A0A494C0V0_HUMAN|nr:acyl-CoA synthetase long chain family member 6 [Homo sapiens]KAI4022523.1 acyl-CoA synthetase long chain family member 6 [Homo sapiens]